ncbi:peptidase M48 Ste24p, partial [Halorubrum tibetense]
WPFAPLSTHRETDEAIERWLSTHPSVDERVERLRRRAEAARLGPVREGSTGTPVR